MAVAGRAGTLWTPFRSFVIVPSELMSEKFVVEGGASAAPRFLMSR